MDRSDWKVQGHLDRDALVEDITHLAEILKRQRVYCIVSASTQEEALETAALHLERNMGIPPRYVKAWNPRRLPT